ncbi:Lysophospholipase 1 [Polyrhizophydium stewartii]|uniref:Lysophospholipase 1 n=1 Tax=Polyrhizophydium stewartii TaxID=2732419 RepID=A0ABR4N3G1_9FUNG
MTSVLQGFRISRILSEATLSTIPLYADAGEHAPARKTASTLSARDVKLLVCLGDSLLTGLCVTAHPGSVKNKVLAALASRPTHSLIVPWMISGEHRNNTCISGGGDGVVSVGRLLKVFSPAIVGLTQHKTYLFSRGSGFNFARSGSTVDGLVEQVHRFVSKLRRPEFCILENHWKLIYIWIGANDVFSRPIDEISRTFEANLVKALQTLRTLVPRAFTCVLTMPNLSRAHVVNTEKRRDLIARKTKLVNDLIRKVVAEYAWNDSEEFRVALQPIPDDEITEDQYGQFISELDGIHPNYLAQQLFAKCIWNNLWLPPERKLTRLADIIQAPWAKPEPSQYIM